MQDLSKVRFPGRWIPRPAAGGPAVVRRRGSHPDHHRLKSASAQLPGCLPPIRDECQQRHRPRRMGSMASVRRCDRWHPETWQRRAGETSASCAHRAKCSRVTFCATRLPIREHLLPRMWLAGSVVITNPVAGRDAISGGFSPRRGHSGHLLRGWAQRSPARRTRCWSARVLQTRAATCQLTSEPSAGPMSRCCLQGPASQVSFELLIP